MDVVTEDDGGAVGLSSTEQLCEPVGGAHCRTLIPSFTPIHAASCPASLPPSLTPSHAASGVMETLNSTQRSGGVAALYRGYGVSAAAIGSYKALYFGLYDTACAAMEQASSLPGSHLPRGKQSALATWAEHEGTCGPCVHWLSGCLPVGFLSLRCVCAHHGLM